MSSSQSHYPERNPDGSFNSRRQLLTPEGASTAVAVLTGVLALGTSFLKIIGVEQSAPEYVNAIIIPTTLILFGIVLGFYFGSREK